MQRRREIQAKTKNKKYKVVLEAKDGNGYITSYYYAANGEALIRELRRRGELQYLMTYDCVSK